MTTVLHRIGDELCDDLERFAPLTRAPRASGLDLTAATLAVRARKLRPQLALTFAAGSDRSPRGVMDDATEIAELVRTWRETHAPSTRRNEEALRAAEVVLERAALFVRLLKRSTSARAAPMREGAHSEKTADESLHREDGPDRIE